MEFSACYGWELDIPEYYVVYGYDDKGYYFSGPGCGSGRGPKPWKDLGDTDIGVLETYIIKPGQAVDDIRTVKEAFGFALEHSKSPAKWIYPRYKAGLVGFDNWIEALEAGRADGFGMAYNSAVWTECRNFAVEFLEEANERIDGRCRSFFDEAKEHYRVVAQNLKRVSELFPFPPKGNEIKDAIRCKQATECLRKARSAEEWGLKTLEKLAPQL